MGTGECSIRLSRQNDHKKQFVSKRALFVICRKSKTARRILSAVFVMTAVILLLPVRLFADTDVTGVRKQDGKLVYIENGCISGKTGVIGKHYFKNGVFSKFTGVAKRLSDKKYVYVKKGIFRRITGKIGKIYYVNGIVQRKKKVSILMIGNSLTSGQGNYTSYFLEQLRKQSGYDFRIRCIAFDNEVLENFASPSNYMGKTVKQGIQSRKWDYVVLQQQTDSAILYGNSMVNAVRVLAKYIKKTSPKAKVLVNSTWAYDMHMYYSHSVQQTIMNDHYKSAAKAVKGKVIYSGNAFDRYRMENGNLYLYQYDRNHASSAGYYLNACCIYARVTGKSPYKVPFYSDLGQWNGRSLQKIAWRENH